MAEAAVESNNKEVEDFNKAEIEKDMKEICNNILIKHLDGRPYEKEKLPFRAIGGFDPIGQPVELLCSIKQFRENGLLLHRRESETPASVAE